MFKIKSIAVMNHDSSFGGYPAKVKVSVQIETKAFNKLCPIINRTKSYFGTSKSVRDLGNLVVDVNNAVYKFNANIPAHSPSIDSQGSKRAVNGVKTLEFVYFVKTAEQAERLGFEVHNFKDGKSVKYGQYINLLKES